MEIRWRIDKSTKRLKDEICGLTRDVEYNERCRSEDMSAHEKKACVSIDLSIDKNSILSGKAQDSSWRRIALGKWRLALG